MDTNMLHSNAMNYRIVKRNSVEVVTNGKASPLSELFQQLLKMNKGESIVIEAKKETQRLIAQRMRSNIFKWKRRKGLRHVGVHLTTDGHVALYYDRP